MALQSQRQKNSTPATATSFSDKGMIVVLMFSTAARAESNRTEASAVHGNVKVAGAFRAE